MITPIGLKQSALNVDRIRVPRRNNAMGNVNFAGKLNAEKIQENAKGLLGSFTQKAKSGLDKIKNSDIFQKITARLHDAMEAVTTKTGKLFDKMKAKKA